MGTVLSKSRTASRKLTFTLERLQGLGVKHPYYLQFLLQIGVILSETRSESGLGKIINAVTKEIRQEAGVFGSIGEIPDTILENVVSDSWLHSILLFCKENDIGVVDDRPELLPKREGDQSLM